MRRLLAWLAYVAFPVLATLYYLVLRLRNAGHAQLRFVHRPGKRYPMVVKPWSKWLCADGMTFGKRVFIRGAVLTPDGEQHEGEHVVQYAELGWWLFLARYGYGLVMHGKGNHFEVKARQRAGET